MILLHIEHAVMNFESWKASFDSHAELRQNSGMLSYRVSRPLDNPNFAIIDLEFNSLSEAQALLTSVQQVWQRVGGTLINNPQWELAEIVDAKVLDNLRA